MTAKVYEYSYSSSYSNLNGKESFEGFEAENNNGKIKAKHTKTENGITTTNYFDNTRKISGKGKSKKLCK